MGDYKDKENNRRKGGYENKGKGEGEAPHTLEFFDKGRGFWGEIVHHNIEDVVKETKG